MSHELWSELDHFQLSEFALASTIFAAQMPMSRIPPGVAPPWGQSMQFCNAQLYAPCCIWSSSGFVARASSRSVICHDLLPLLLNTSFCDCMANGGAMSHELWSELDHFQLSEFASLDPAIFAQKLVSCNGIHQSWVWPFGIPPDAAPPWWHPVRLKQIGLQGDATLCLTSRVVPLGSSLRLPFSPNRKRRRYRPQYCPSSPACQWLGPSRNYT